MTSTSSRRMPNSRKPVDTSRASVTIGALLPWIIALATLAILPAPSIRSAAPEPGALIKGSGPTVYYHGRNAKRYVFPNLPTYATWYRDFSRVQTVSDTQLAAIPMAGNVTYRPGVRLVKVTTDPKVYAVDRNGTLRWVTTENVAATLYGPEWHRLVDDLPDAFFVNYRVGESIVTPAEFDRTRATAAATSIDADKGLVSGAVGAPETVGEPVRAEPRPTETARSPETATPPPPSVTRSPTAPSGVPADFTIAFIGDQSVLPDAASVLQLIKKEGADLVLHQGDFDYVDDPEQWEAMVNRELGADFPYLAVIGDHDVKRWSAYKAKLVARANRIGATCTGDYGIRSTCTYQGLTIVGAGGFHVGTGTQDPMYVRNALAAATTPWRICSTHQSLRYIDQLVQLYDECRKGGAIIAGAHEHLYVRSHLVDDFVKKTIADRGPMFDITLGKTVAFISGLGGKSVDDLRDGLFVPRDWWATRYTRAEGARSGALFCMFNPDGVAPDRANCAFKDIGGKIADAFTLVNRVTVSTAEPASTAPIADAPRESLPVATSEPTRKTTPTPPAVTAPAVPPVPVASTPKIVSASSSPLGTNLSEHQYWSGAWIFADAFKQSQTWISGELGGCWACGPLIDLDADGWVRSLQRNAGNGKPQTANTIVFGGAGNRFPSGTYTVHYDGEGTIAYGGSGRKNTIASTNGRDLVDVDGSQSANFTLGITSTDPRGAGNYLRNIRVMMPGGACANNPAKFCTVNADCGGNTCEQFADHPDRIQLHPNFLANVAPFRVIRYMDLMGTNHAPFQTYGDYSQRTDAQWPQIPAEVIAQISNETGTDPWVTLPHQADDAFVRSFAQALKDNLRSERKVFIEYSNEVWNPGFSQIADVARAGCNRNTDLRNGCDQDTTPRNGRYCEGFPGTWNPTCGTAARREFSERSVEIWDIFEPVFGGTSRIVRVMASQIGQPSLHRDLLSWKNAHQKTDALATAPYFGGGLGGRPEVITWSVDQVFTEITQNAIPQALALVDKDIQFLRQNYPSIALIAYEGGQHLVGLNKTAPDGNPFRENGAMTSIFTASNRDPRMKSAYQTYLGGLAQRGVQLFVHFQNVGRFTKYGSWGAKENEDRSRASSPKFDALTTYAEQHPCNGACTP